MKSSSGILLLLLVSEVVGHGRMMDPPARNSMWRLGFKNPTNHNDNELYCGGLSVQKQNGGKCGVCGDNFKDKPPRAHETGGKYGKGLIGRKYGVGQTIKIKVELTANHKGHFEMKLCPNEGGKPITQECLDKNKLKLAKQPEQSVYRLEKQGSGTFDFEVKLPESVECKTCVIQWMYTAGNNWGKCKNGTEGMGCGAQETFVNCADVSISKDVKPGSVPDKPTPEGGGGSFYRNSLTNEPLEVKHKVCVPVGPGDGSSSPEFCQTNCLRYPPNCPKDKCKCLSKCRAIGSAAKDEGSDFRCERQCLKYPSECPQEQCECESEEEAECEEGQEPVGAGGEAREGYYKAF